MPSGGLDNSSETNRLLRSLAQGQTGGWDTLMLKHRDRLRRMVSLRLDRRMRGWIDPSDVIRQSYADAAAQQGEYLQKRGEPFFLWLRRLTGQKLHALQQQQLGEPLPQAGHDLSLHRASMPPTNSLALAAQLLGQAPQLSQAELRQQRMAQLEEVLNNMGPLEREVLALRHFEQLNNAETAAILELKEGEASKLYIRALKKLKEILNSLTGPNREK